MFPILVFISLPVAPSAVAVTNDTIGSFSLSGSPFAEGFAPLPEHVEARLVLDPPYLPRPTLMPSVLSESLYLSNPAELEALKRADVRLSLAAAIYISIAEYLNARQLGIRYGLLHGPNSPVATGSPVSYGIRVTNRGNAPSSGWTLQLHSVPAVQLYDGSGQLGDFMGSVAVPDGLQPGASVDLTISGVAPASPGEWLVKSDVRLDDESYASPAGVVSMQIQLTTIAP